MTTGVIETAGKFTDGVVDTSGKLQLASLTPVANLSRTASVQMQITSPIYYTIRKGESGIIKDPEEDDL
jgi:hypothetical protein